LHHSKLIVSSGLNKGSVFSFQLILEKHNSSDEINEPIEEVQNKEKLSILLVEDKVINQKVAKLMLENMEHTVVIAENGQECLDLLEKKKYQVILMDIQMPVMNGTEATKKIIEKYEKERPLIIGLSANGMQGDKEKYIKIGMDDYLSKPIKYDILQSALTNIITKNSDL